VLPRPARRGPSGMGRAHAEERAAVAATVPATAMLARAHAPSATAACAGGDAERSMAGFIFGVGGAIACGMPRRVKGSARAR
jgi:hypothetical protein